MLSRGNIKSLKLVHHKDVGQPTSLSFSREKAKLIISISLTGFGVVLSLRRQIRKTRRGQYVPERLAFPAVDLNSYLARCCFNRPACPRACVCTANPLSLPRIFVVIAYVPPFQVWTQKNTSLRTRSDRQQQRWWLAELWVKPKWAVCQR